MVEGGLNKVGATDLALEVDDLLSLPLGLVLLLPHPPLQLLVVLGRLVELHLELDPLVAVGAARETRTLGLLPQQVVEKTLQLLDDCLEKSGLEGVLNFVGGAGREAQGSETTIRIVDITIKLGFFTSIRETVTICMN